MVETKHDDVESATLKRQQQKAQTRVEKSYQAITGGVGSNLETYYALPYRQRAQREAGKEGIDQQQPRAPDVTLLDIGGVALHANA